MLAVRSLHCTRGTELANCRGIGPPPNLQRDLGMGEESVGRSHHPPYVRPGERDFKADLGHSAKGRVGWGLLRSGHSCTPGLWWLIESKRANAWWYTVVRQPFSKVTTGKVARCSQCPLLLLRILRFRAVLPALYESGSSRHQLPVHVPGLPAFAASQNCSSEANLKKQPVGTRIYHNMGRIEGQAIVQSVTVLPS